MALRVSTTGSNVSINDLGIILTDPINNLDLTEQFTATELRDSLDLTNAIQNGNLIVDDGIFTIDGNDYDPNQAFNQELDLKLDSRFISHTELNAGNNNTEIVSGVFPLSLNSTASSTRNVYAPGAKWGTWSLDAGDIIVISGSSGADGTYTVESVTDSQNFITVESIPDSTGGNITAYHPAAATRIGIDSTTLSFTSSSNLQGALEDISLGTVFDINRMILETDGSNIYTGNGDLLITVTPLPQTVDQDF